MQDDDRGTPRHAAQPDDLPLRWWPRRRRVTTAVHWVPRPVPADDPGPATAPVAGAAPAVRARVAIDPFARTGLPPQPVWSPLPPWVRSTFVRSTVGGVPTQRQSAVPTGAPVGSRGLVGLVGAPSASGGSGGSSASGGSGGSGAPSASGPRGAAVPEPTEQASTLTR